MSSTNSYGVFSISGGELYYSSNARNVSSGAPVENGYVSNNVSYSSSGAGVNLVNFEKPIDSVFLIRGYTNSVGDFISLNLNQFQDANGTVLSGTLNVVFDGSVWVPSVIN
jgi:hypothetical protein